MIQSGLYENIRKIRGGLDGISGGTASTPVAGSRMIYWGYSGVSVYAPYRSVIFRQNPL